MYEHLVDFLGPKRRIGQASALLVAQPWWSLKQSVHCIDIIMPFLGYTRAFRVIIYIV